jgi:glutathione peroxidase
LEKLYRDYKDQGLVVLGFPANNFNGQEPGTDAEILEFCTGKYDVTFPMFSKISVKGDDMHPLYKWLVGQTGNREIEWNFAKFVIGPKGDVIHRLSSRDNPSSDAFRAKIEELLKR